MLLANWSDYLIVIVAVCSLLTLKINLYFKLLSCYLFVLSALTMATVITANYQINNFYLYHAIGFVELVFVFLLYRCLELSTSWNVLFIATFIIYSVDSCYLIGNHIQEINSVGHAVTMLFTIGLGMQFIWKLYREEKVEYLGHFSYFYISAGQTLFASGAFFGYLLIARISDEKVPDENFYHSWLIISGFAAIKFILILTGIFIGRKYAK